MVKISRKNADGISRRRGPKRMEQFAADILAATISGLIVLAVQKLLNW